MALERTISRSFILRLALPGLLATALSAPLALDASAGSNGIQALLAVSQQKANEANDDALNGADKQRDLMEQQKALREKQARQAEAQDKMGNFEIQDLMSRSDQSQNAASSVQKKQDDTQQAVINKIN